MRGKKKRKDLDFLSYASVFNFLRINEKYAYICKPNFLKEHLSYCLSNNIISSELLDEPFFSDKVISKCDNLEMTNPYRGLDYDSDEKMYWSYELYNVKLPTGWELKSCCSGTCNLFCVIDEKGTKMKKYPFFKDYYKETICGLDLVNDSIDSIINTLTDEKEVEEKIN